MQTAKDTKVALLTFIAAMVTASPGVKIWVVRGCNDENVQGGVTALQTSASAPIASSPSAWAPIWPARTGPVTSPAA
ncbi:hypothetical protein [Kitasatospora purpeofusca]|uniref:hypothetical protein n=1 Tax=Kitasatospora purpeofusca TaxID=67352 RepID=UPI0038287844